jgi:hypothetical protein
MSSPAIVKKLIFFIWKVSYFLKKEHCFGPKVYKKYFPIGVAYKVNFPGTWY